MPCLLGVGRELQLKAHILTILAGATKRYVDVSGWFGQ